MSFFGPTQALREIVRLVNRAALDHDPGRLHLHASAVAFDDRALVLSAPSGRGKTTTAAALLLGGASYLTDEAIALDERVALVEGFPKPMTVRGGAVELLPRIADHAVRVTPRSGPPLLVPVSALDAPWQRTATPFAVAILERDDTTTEPLVEPMSRADACVALVQESLDFDRFGARALETVATLCATSHCLRVTLGEPQATAALLADVVAGLAPPDAVPTRAGLGPGSQCKSDSRWIVSEVVRWVIIGDEVVLHHGETGAVVSLLAPAADWWTGVASVGPAATMDVDDLAVELASRGFIRRVEDA